jgi:hypothetical protein
MSIIQKIGKNFGLAWKSKWRPGLFESYEAARIADEMEDDVLRKLQTEAQGVITLERLLREVQESGRSADRA